MICALSVNDQKSWFFIGASTEESPVVLSCLEGAPVKRSRQQRKLPQIDVTLLNSDKENEEQESDEELPVFRVWMKRAPLSVYWWQNWCTIVIVIFSIVYWKSYSSFSLTKVIIWHYFLNCILLFVIYIFTCTDINKSDWNYFIVSCVYGPNPHGKYHGILFCTHQFGSQLSSS